MRKQILMLALLSASSGTFSVVSAQGQDKFNFHVGGGIGTPRRSTAEFAGISGAFQVGAGPNLNQHSSLVGEFMWHGLPPNNNALRRVANPLVSPALVLADNFEATSNLYALTANYRYHREGKMYGFYVMGGGGWYYRHSELKNYHVAPGTVCEPVWDWWGYVCQGGFVSTENVLVAKGVAAAGVNGGGGIVIKLRNTDVKWYMEVRYHYSPQGNQNDTHLLPVTFGFQW
jgi:hypothetical protein